MFADDLTARQQYPQLRNTQQQVCLQQHYILPSAIIPLVASPVITAAEEAEALRTQVLLDFNDAPALRHVNVDTWNLKDLHSLLHLLTPPSLDQTALLQLLAVATPPEDAADIWDA